MVIVFMFQQSTTVTGQKYDIHAFSVGAIRAFKPSLDHVSFNQDVLVA